MKKYLPYLAVGFEVTVLMLMGYYVGRYFDQSSGSQGLYSAVGLFTGLIVWVIRIVVKNRREKL